jgi:hypothetical protein
MLLSLIRHSHLCCEIKFWKLCNFTSHYIDFLWAQLKLLFSLPASSVEHAIINKQLQNYTVG